MSIFYKIHKKGKNMESGKLERAKWWEWGILFFLFLVNLYLTLGLTPLFDLDEGAFGEATREMLVNHNFITTYLNGELRFDKPILIYWLQALSVSIFGLTDWAFRLPSALATTGWGVVIYLFTSRLWGERRGVWATIIFISSLQIGLIGKAGIADALLNLWLAVAGLSLFLYLREKREKWLLLTFGAVGLGFLTKGPVAILVPLATFFLYSGVIKKEWKLFFRSVFNWKGLVIFSVIALPWYIAEYLQQGEKFIAGFFLKHNIQRFETSFESHAGSLFYYIPVVLIGLLPWTTLFLKVLKGGKNLIKTPFGLYGLLWFGFVFLFFSLSGTKLPHYVIYGYTPLFILMAFQLEKCKSQLLLISPFLIFLVILLALPFTLRALLPAVKDPFFKTAVITLLPYFNKTYFLVIFLSIGALLFPTPLRVKGAIMGIISVGILNYLIWIYAHFIQFPIKEISKYVRTHKIEKVVMWHLNTPSFILYTGQLVERRRPEIGEIVLTKKSQLPKLPGFKILIQRGGVALVKVTPPTTHRNPFNYRRDIRQ
ncbi:MAG: phospholipid carrier-dependent glycosyltransferase [Epsilonproteobacteria bacterium]|nr:phospholipid carrier-dependent glycosyltransferase [Campylobacterota bacterium]